MNPGVDIGPLELTFFGTLTLGQTRLNPGDIIVRDKISQNLPQL